MNLAELRKKIAREGGDPDEVVVSTREEDFDSWGYNVVPQPDGTYIIKTGDGRDGWNTVKENIGSPTPRAFRSEDEFCDWIWKRIQSSKVSPDLIIVRTPEEEEQERLKDEENYQRILARFEAARAARTAEAATEEKE
ncbi:hypothetical protein [Mesorhizobium japonicum]|uniref:hypothetical protein n=1 Tax=Mesorhizobium japonicum TaxID=2066070 RepID=UPI003B5AC7A4